MSALRAPGTQRPGSLGQCPSSAARSAQGGAGRAPSGRDEGRGTYVIRNMQSPGDSDGGGGALASQRGGDSSARGRRKMGSGEERRREKQREAEPAGGGQTGGL